MTNDNGGIAQPTDWILSATSAGGGGISGQTGSGSVTEVGVPPGSYTLSESGPPGYSASTWSCVGGSQTGASIAVALGQSATCTITNNDQPAQLTLIKTVTNDNGGTATPNGVDVERGRADADQWRIGQCGSNGGECERRHLCAHRNRSGRVHAVGLVVRRRHATAASIVLGPGRPQRARSTTTTSPRS